MSTIRSSRRGRNSCSGGSSVRMVTGKPSMALEQADEILALHRQQLLRAPRGDLSRCRRESWPACAADSVLGEEHVLGAAQADAFGAERARLVASRGMSALARTPSLRNGSAQLMNFMQFRIVGLGGHACSSLPLMTRPVVPSSEIQSPSLKTWPFTRISRVFSLTSMSPAPATQHLPMPRVTTAAWLVMPPREVRMPCATSMP